MPINFRRRLTAITITKLLNNFSAFERLKATKSRKTISQTLTADINGLPTAE